MKSLAQIIGCIRQRLLVKKIDHFGEEFLKLLEISCHFDMPKACHLVLLLGIMISSVGRSMCFSKEIAKRQ